MDQRTTCPLDFVVVGDSVAGIGCAFTLAFVGHRVTVLEKLGEHEKDAQPNNGGMRLPPNIARIIRMYPGTLPLFDKATKLDGLEFRTGDTNEVMGRMCFDSQIMEDLGSDYYLISHHNYTTFARNFCHEMGVKFRYDFPVKSIETSKDGPAVVVGENGERIEGDVIIGADGHNSVVREYLLAQQPEDDEDEDDSASTSTAGPMGMYRTLTGASLSVPMEEMRRHPELKDLVESTQYCVWMGDGYCATGGVHGNIYTLGVNITRPLSPNDLDLEWTDSAPSDFLHSFMPDAHSSIKHLISIAKVAHPTVQHIHPVESYVDIHSKAVIVGDAAHCTPLHGTHNSSLAIEDTFAMGNLFAHITHKCQIPAFLRGFNEVRIPRSKHVANNELGGLSSTSLPPGPHRDLRNQGMLYSLVIANAPDEHAEELAQMWMSWIMLTNYDAQESISEWWLDWGRHISEMQVNGDAA